MNNLKRCGTRDARRTHQNLGDRTNEAAGNREEYMFSQSFRRAGASTAAALLLAPTFVSAHDQAPVPRITRPGAEKQQNIFGEISFSRDVDYFAFQAIAGQQITIEPFAARLRRLHLTADNKRLSRRSERNHPGHDGDRLANLARQGEVQSGQRCNGLESTRSA